MNRVVHFEIYASDPAQAIAFYQHVFGWQIKRWGPPEAEYWHINTGTDTSDTQSRGIDGGLWRRPGPNPQEDAAVNAFICTIEVESIDDTLEKIKRTGGSIAGEKNQIPGVGWLAYARDPEGNMFGVVQRSES